MLSQLSRKSILMTLIHAHLSFKGYNNYYNNFQEGPLVEAHAVRTLQILKQLQLTFRGISNATCKEPPPISSDPTVFTV